MAHRRFGPVAWSIAAGTLWMVVLCLASPAPAGGQWVEAGDSVRLRLTGALRLEALAVQVEGETLFLQTTGIDGLWPVATTDLATLEVLRLRTPQQAFRRGFGMGVVAGLFVGAATGLALHSVGAVGSPDDPPAELLVQTTLTFAGLGMIAGGFAAGMLAARHPGMGWISIRLPAS